MPSSAIDNQPARVPPRFRDRTFAGYVPGTPSQRRALAEAQRLAKGELSSLVLIGPAGVGKSHLAAAIVNAVREREEPLRTERRREYEREYNRRLEGQEPWTRFNLKVPPADVLAWQNVADLTTGLRSDMDRPLDDRFWSEHLEDTLRTAALLVLDDLGREKVSDWTGELVYGLINHRYEWQRVTIVTSNLTPAQLQESGYWTGISRLAEDGALIEINAPDHRLRRG